MKRCCKAIRERLGHRGLFLLLLGTVQIGYGTGLLAAASPAREHWWPASVSSLGGFPLDTWGIIWTMIGGLCLVLAWTKADRIAFAAAALLNTGWAAFAYQRWAATGEAGAWAPAVIYTGIAISILIISGWPEPVPAPTPQQVDDLTESSRELAQQISRLIKPPHRTPP